MTVAYEHIRIDPRSELACELMRKSLEDGVNNDMIDQPEPRDIHDHDQPLEQTLPEILGSETGDEDVIELNLIGKPMITSDTSFCCNHAPADGQPTLEIGNSENTGDFAEASLARDKQAKLEQLYKIVGGKQLSKKKLECASV